MIARIQLAAKLVQTRDDVKRLLGERWPAKVDEYRPLFAATMEQNDCNELEAIGYITREHGPLPSLLTAVLVAVAVELTEARQ